MRFYEVDSSVDAIMSAAMLAQTRASSTGKQGKLSMNGFLQMLANSGIMMDYDGFKTVYDTNPQIANVIAQFNKDSITFVGDSDDEDAEFEPDKGEIPDDQRVAKMAKSAMRTREFVEAKLTEDTATMVARELKKMGVAYNATEDEIIKQIPSALKSMDMQNVLNMMNTSKDYRQDLLSDIIDAVADNLDEAELPPHLSKMFGKDGSQVETRTDVMKQMRDIVDNKSAMKVKFGDGDQMVDMYTASVLVQIYDKVNDANKEKIVQRVGTIEKFMKLMPKLFGMIGEGSSPHPKGSKKYKAHMAAKHANMNEDRMDRTISRHADAMKIHKAQFKKTGDAKHMNAFRDAKKRHDTAVQKQGHSESLEDKIYADIKAGMSKDAIISKYANKDNDPLLIDVMYSRIKFKMNEGKSVNEAWQAFNEAEEKSYTVVHAKHGKEVIKATSSYGAAKKYADMKKLKSTAGVDAHLMERDKT